MNAVNEPQALLDEVLASVGAAMANPVPELSADTDLFSAGLDSITLMRLIADWRKRGYRVDFASLAREPCARRWAEHLSANASQAARIDEAPNTQPPASDHSGSPFPLAPMQYAYWVGRNPSQPLGGVSAHLYTEFDRAGHALSGDRLSTALATLVRRHGSLRLKVTSDGQQQQLAPEPAGNVSVNDWRSSDSARAEDQLHQWRERWSSRMLDLSAGEVIALALSLLPDGRSRLHLDVDMVAADAVSYRTLLRELAILYENPEAELPPLPASYRDCRLNVEQRWPEVKNTAGQWWQQRLPQLPDGPQLPVKPVSDAPPRTTRRHFHADAALRSRLYAASRQHGLTPAAVMATIMAETLAGWSREPRFLLNVPLFLRPMDGPDISGVVGDFSSSILLDVDMSERQTFAGRARVLQARLHQDAAHAEYSGVHVLRDLGRLRGRQVTAPVVFTSALNLGELFDPAVRRVFGDPVWIISQGPQVLLDTQVTELDGGLLINWDCREDAFVDGVLGAMFAFFKNALLALAGDPQRWSRCLADDLPAERARAQAADSAGPTPGGGAAQTPLEQTVAAVWREVIGDSGEDIQRNLFAAGGDSMLATSLVARLREIFGVHSIDMQRLFEAPSIAGLAASIRAADDPQRVTEIAQIYCEILAMDDEALLAELEQPEAVS